MAEKKAKLSLETLMTIVNLIQKINTQYHTWRHSIDMEYHSNKDYYTLNVQLNRGTSEYKDCVVIYNDAAEFDEKAIAVELEKIFKKSLILTE